ncbi:prolactin regulatory element-binding protein isoform X2 [Gopherus flavomarginatus]|uniref:prolactin regulatory element-binding protein isoform X2 n=1 Tax=Gopherus flavomarginatus TaxID=286002 RepID=UPI0021CBC717|nr:prolactin regulatory element-binding protein isoform X2 [Gopherus flavomarginatus]
MHFQHLLGCGWFWAGLWGRAPAACGAGSGPVLCLSSPCSCLGGSWRQVLLGCDDSAGEGHFGGCLKPAWGLRSGPSLGCPQGSPARPPSLIALCPGVSLCSLQHFLQLEQIGGQLSASLLHSHDTETRATMSMALAGDVIAAGQDASCHVLRFRLQGPDEKSSSSTPSKAGGAQKGPRKRKAPSPSEKGEVDTRSEAGEVAVETLCSVQTDFSPDALQKAVRVSADHSLLATGGADGFLRVWEFPSMKKVLEFKAHDGEIEDIALGPENKVVTAGRDFQCCVWQRDQLVLRLRWDENMPGVPDKTYRYQACRFGTVPDQAEALRLYTVQVPHKRGRRPPPCYLTKWDGKSFLPLLTQPCGGEVISCLSVSDSGTFLGLGTVTGSVAIHVSFSLQRLYYVKEAHGIVVTDVAFLPESRRGRELLAENEAALLSVAVDSRCKLHLLPPRRSFPVWLLLLLCAGLVVATILLLQLAFPGFL